MTSTNTPQRMLTDDGAGTNLSIVLASDGSLHIATFQRGDDEVDQDLVLTPADLVRLVNTGRLG